MHLKKILPQLSCVVPLEHCECTLARDNILYMGSRYVETENEMFELFGMSSLALVFVRIRPCVWLFV